MPSLPLSKLRLQGFSKLLFTSGQLALVFQVLAKPDAVPSVIPLIVKKSSAWMLLKFPHRPVGGMRVIEWSPSGGHGWTFMCDHIGTYHMSSAWAQNLLWCTPAWSVTAEFPAEYQLRSERWWKMWTLQRFSLQLWKLSKNSRWMHYKINQSEEVWALHAVHIQCPSMLVTNL